MKNFDFCVVGNIFVDTIQTTDNFDIGCSNIGMSTRDSLGGTMNTARNLCEIDATSKIFLSTAIGTDAHGLYALDELKRYWNEKKGFDYHAYCDGKRTTSALIICETEKKRRSSIVNWGACSESSNLFFPSSKWYHFMYLDTLYGLEEKIFKEISKGSIISADLCLSSHSDAERKRIMNIMKYLDYVILSEDSANSIADETIEIYSAMTLGEKVKKAAVVHTPKGSFISSKGQEYMASSDYIDDMKLDVLGAGDAFAARFIYNTAKDPANIKENAASAHKFATNFIKGKR